MNILFNCQGKKNINFEILLENKVELTFVLQLCRTEVSGWL